MYQNFLYLPHDSKLAQKEESFPWLCSNQILGKKGESWSEWLRVYDQDHSTDRESVLLLRQKLLEFMEILDIPPNSLLFGKPPLNLHGWTRGIQRGTQTWWLQHSKYRLYGRMIPKWEPQEQCNLEFLPWRSVCVFEHLVFWHFVLVLLSF